ncbi:hypothetical protein [Deinococcus sp. DB0503]|uniref:hypothetical protein n=1 Tax=Deinococcus sp. DB0503 TaxID=2479203 RepID=UPI0018E04646|nr:hypothetical protein [Deinococcus sp. DB0503]
MNPEANLNNISRELDDNELEQAMVLMLFDMDYLYTLLSLSSRKTLYHMVNLAETIHHLGDSKQLGELFVNEGARIFKMATIDLKQIICIEWNYSERRKVSGYGDPRRLISDVAELLESKCTHFHWYRDDRAWLLIFATLLSRNLSNICVGVGENIHAQV